MMPGVHQKEKEMERNINNHHNREKGVFNGSGDNTTNNLVRTSTHPPETRSALATTSSDFVLQWGNRKRLRCMKVQGKDRSSSSGAVRADRRVVRSDLNGSKEDTLNLRQRPASPLPAHRILRNSEIAMKGGYSNGVGVQDKRGSTSVHNSAIAANNHHNHSNNNHHQNNNGGVGSGSASDVAHDAKKGGNGAGTSSGSDAMPAVWPPKFVIALTNKEKEEDFYAFKGSKLPQRPKKRSKFIQRTLNMVSPGTWLSDLTLERYEVREKKTSKKRPRGLKAMGNMESDSE